ncbi:MAG: primosomal protein N' [Planctomycetota bacterium]
MGRTRQQNLFDVNANPWEGEDSGVYAQVVFDRPLRVVFTYKIPFDLLPKTQAGKRVLAPFGKGSHRTTGYCVGVTHETPSGTHGGDALKLKSIQAVLDSEPLLSSEMLRLTQWIADVYRCGWGQVLESVLPRGVKHEAGTRWALFLIPVAEEERPATPLTAKQQRALDALIEFKRPALIKEIGQQARCGPDCVKSLVEKGYAKSLRQRVVSRAPKIEPVLWDKPPELNPYQRSALERIRQRVIDHESGTFLLHGVTGSGKTEVYLRAIAEVVERGREAIVLVPEISLTPQTIERFRRRFDHVAVLHSHLSDVDRRWHWSRIAAGEVNVVVGARSAIFAPCKNLGLIVLDEEHESTFKQENTPRYHARDVAIQRGLLEKVPVVLGSATPSLESYLAAKEKRFEMLSIPERVKDLLLPKVDIIDLKNEYKPGQAMQAISRPLAHAIDRTVKEKGQVILLLNRRGFSTALLCPQCGHVEKCKHCDISLTFHKQLDRLLCHGCDAEFSVPERCPECKLPAIRFSGFGTERLEEEVRSRFPQYHCARMDSDTMRSAQHYERVLSAFRQGSIDILLGTQMIAKGLDFPNVHLVGVISADTARNLPDFRAAERTFQLIAQVAGRTGRGETPGRVLVQTFSADDPSILAASRHDYLGFAERELPIRAEYGYPPHQQLVRIIVRSTLESHAKEASRLLASRFRQVLVGRESARVLGPAVAPIPRLKDYHRMHFQIHVPHGFDRQALLDAALDGVELPGDAEFVVDVDPVSML